MSDTSMVSDSASTRDPAAAARVILRPLASPLPLGFLGLAGGTITLAGQELGWLPSAESHQVAAAILLLAVPLQALASVLGFLSRDPVVATGMGTLTVSWATSGVLMLLGAPGSRSPVLGFVLFYLAAAVALAAALALLSKLLTAVVLTLAAARFAVTGVSEYVGGTGWTHAAGWVGLALCVVALTAAATFALEDARRTLLAATGRRGFGRQALAGSGMGTIGPVAREAGVRDQL